MKKYLSLMSKRTKLKCVGVIAMALISSLLASVWPVRLGALYTSISNGAIRTIAQGLAAILVFGLIYLASECITIARRVLIDCIIATHETEVRESSIPLDGENRFDTSVDGAADKIVKLLCNKGMVDPFKNVAVEVSGAKQWQ